MTGRSRDSRSVQTGVQKNYPFHALNLKNEFYDLIFDLVAT